MMARNFGSDNKEFAVLPGTMIFFSLSLETNVGLKSMKTSLEHIPEYFKVVYSLIIK